MPVGLTKGYGRHRADFYHFHGRPKKLWLKPLGKRSTQQVRDLLRGPLPAQYQLGAHSSAAGLLPIPDTVAYSLVTALQRVEDPHIEAVMASHGSLTCGAAVGISDNSGRPQADSEAAPPARVAERSG